MYAHKFNTVSKTKPSIPSGITELILSRSGSAPSIVFPMLAHLSQNTNDRWLTWIIRNSTPYNIKQTLQEYNFDSKKIRLVHCSNEEDTFGLFHEALSNGTSSAVIAETKGLSERYRTELESSAAKSKTQGLLLHYRL